MHRRVPSVVIVALLALMVVVAAGCGGGGDQSGGQSNDQQGNGGEKKKGPEIKIALGTIQSINPESKGIAIKPSKGKDKMIFSLKKAKITLDGKEAKLEDIARNQQAQIEYIEGKEKVNRARSVELFSAEEKTGGSMEGEGTG